MAAKDDLAFIAQRIRKLVNSEPKDADFLGAVWRLVRKAMDLGVCAGVQFTEFNKFFDSQRENETYDTRRDVFGRQVVTPAPISRLPLTMLEAMKWLAENGTDIGLSVPSELPTIGDFESVIARAGSPFEFRIKYPSRDTLRPHVEFLASLIEVAPCQQSTKTPCHSPDDSAFVAAKTLREQRGTVHADGHFGPDGFCLDGVLATGLTDNELALLKLALDKQPDGPTEDDVYNLTEFKSWTRERLDKLLGTIKAKFLTAKCPRVLRWANRHLVFREPHQRAKAAPKSVSKTNGRKAGRMRGETLQKDGRHKRR